MSAFVETNGIKLHYLDYPGDGPAVVLAHGLTANCRSFDVVAGHLAPRLRVIAPDLRGRGASDKPATGYTMADHAADVLGLLDALGREVRVAPAVGRQLVEHPGRDRRRRPVAQDEDLRGVRRRLEAPLADLLRVAHAVCFTVMTSPSRMT